MNELELIQVLNNGILTSYIALGCSVVLVVGTLLYTLLSKDV